VSEEALDMLAKMLKYDHAERITPKDAMEHPYFKPVKEHHAKTAAAGGSLAAGGKAALWESWCDRIVYLNTLLKFWCNSYFLVIFNKYSKQCYL